MPPIPKNRTSPVFPKPQFVWIKQPVLIHVTSDGKPMNVTLPGKRLGQVAVHPTPRGTPDWRAWTVTALTVGLSLCVVDTEEDATKIAAVVMVKAGTEVMSLDDPVELRKSLPAWMESWLLECRKQGRYVDQPTQ